MKRKKILVFDSGAGGVNVFVRLVEKFDGAEFFYLSDAKNAPYGEKTAEELLLLSGDAIGKYDGKFDAAVLACNTLSTNVKDKLEEKFGVPFFGIYPEPREKEPTLILCTRATARACEEKFGQNPFCETFVPDGWVEETERTLPKLREEFFLSSLRRFRGEKYAFVLLGCTHFIYLADIVKSVFPSACIIDGTEKLFDKIEQFLGKSVGRRATCEHFAKITAKNFFGDDFRRNFELFRYLSNSKSY
mgnify:CR=1 FL=1